MIERAMAVAATALIPAALRALPLRATLTLCDRWPRTPGARCASGEALARRVDRWLARGRGPWRPTCLTRAVVLYTLLRQHGHVPRLHIGASGSAERFRAHAWITLGGTPIGEFEAPLDHHRELLAHGA